MTDSAVLDASTIEPADDREAVLAVARRGRNATVALRALHRSQKDAALLAIADALDAATDRIVGANASTSSARSRTALTRRSSTASP